MPHNWRIIRTRDFIRYDGRDKTDLLQDELFILTYGV
jgi:hypothetical protein